MITGATLIVFDPSSECDGKKEKGKEKRGVHFIVPSDQRFTSEYIRILNSISLLK
jgi:hypothetical protein